MPEEESIDELLDAFEGEEKVVTVPPLTPEQRDELRERIAAATPGPWYAVVNDLIGGVAVSTHDKFVADHDLHERVVADMVTSDEDAKFIAAASPDVIVALLDERDRLAAELTNAIEGDGFGSITYWRERSQDAQRDLIVSCEAHAKTLWELDALRTAARDYYDATRNPTWIESRMPGDGPPQWAHRRQREALAVALGGDPQ